MPKIDRLEIHRTGEYAETSVGGADLSRHRRVRRFLTQDAADLWGYGPFSGFHGVSAQFKGNRVACRGWPPRCGGPDACAQGADLADVEDSVSAATAPTEMGKTLTAVAGDRIHHGAALRRARRRIPGMSRPAPVRHGARHVGPGPKIGVVLLRSQISVSHIAPSVRRYPVVT